MSLKAKLVPWFLAGLIAFGALLFIPAGSIRFWQGWVYLLVWMVPGFSTFAYLCEHSPKLIERRMRFKEKVPEQKVIVKFVYVTWLIAMLLPGLDHRFRWSHIPLWLTVLSQAVVFAGMAMALWSTAVNSYASRIIQVEPGQPVISTGPYHVVRHPMYLGMSVVFLFTPLALGSWVTLPAFVLLVLLIVLRLLNEEKVLRQELPGYNDYCLHTRYRLLPFLF